jgi:YHS domain-containing protein
MRLRLLLTTIAGTALLSGLPLNATPQVATPPSNAQAADEAIGGLDPVRLVQGAEVDGSDSLTVTYHGLVYYFSTPDTKAAFEAAPSRYSVHNDGLCARMGPPVLGAQSLYAVHDGRIYVFGSEDCQKAFKANAARYIDSAPSPLEGATPEQLTRGRALLDRAVAAHGGAALATLRGYRERTTQELAAMQGPVTVSVETTALLPDRWRQDTSNRFGRFLLVITPDTAFRAGARMAPRPIPGALRRYYRGALGTHPLALLHAHRTAPLHAVSLDPANGDGARHDRVAVEHDGAVIVLTLDPSGRITSQTTRAHGPRDGVVGTIVRTWSDFRTVGAFTLPHRVEAAIDGVANADLSYAVTSIEIDPPIDAAAIVRPIESQP